MNKNDRRVSSQSTALLVSSYDRVARRLCCVSGGRAPLGRLFEDDLAESAPSARRGVYEDGESRARRDGDAQRVRVPVDDLVRQRVKVPEELRVRARGAGRL